MNEFTQAPAFDLYPERWTHGTRHMSKVARSDYMDLLCHQWTEDGLPDDLEVLAHILGYKKPSQIPRAVIIKFPPAEEGKRRNKRLELERKKQKERFERKSLGASKTNAKRWGKESLSDQLAIPNGVANTSPPPTSDLRPPTIQTSGEWAERIFQAYPRQDAPMLCMAAIRGALDAGADPETVLRQVKECAHEIKRAPGGSDNHWIPRAKTFFEELRWPEAGVFKSRVDGLLEAVEKGEKNDQPVTMQLH